jgi:hypothetical protein
MTPRVSCNEHCVRIRSSPAGETTAAEIRVRLSRRRRRLGSGRSAQRAGVRRADAQAAGARQHRDPRSFHQPVRAALGGAVRHRADRARQSDLPARRGGDCPRRGRRRHSLHALDRGQHQARAHRRDRARPRLVPALRLQARGGRGRHRRPRRARGLRRAGADRRRAARGAAAARHPQQFHGAVQDHAAGRARAHHASSAGRSRRLPPACRASSTSSNTRRW